MNLIWKEEAYRSQLTDKTEKSKNQVADLRSRKL